MEYDKSGKCWCRHEVANYTLVSFSIGGVGVHGALESQSCVHGCGAWITLVHFEPVEKRLGIGHNMVKYTALVPCIGISESDPKLYTNLFFKRKKS